MDFDLNTEQRQLQSTTRQFASSELAGLAEMLEKESVPVPLDWRKRYADLGLLGVNTAEEYGGLGLSLLDAILIIEEAAKVSVAVAFPIFECLTGPVRIVEKFGAPELKNRILPAAVRGEALVAISMSEPDAGTALTDLRTRAEVAGDQVVLNGTKRWCSGAGHSEYYVVFCRFDNIPGAKGVGAVLVDKDTPGVTFGPQEQLMGFRGVPSADIYLDNVSVPKTNILVEAGSFGRLMEVFNIERLGNAAMALGTAAGALEQAKAYVTERSQFGKPIVDFQAIQLRLAEMEMKTEASRLLIYRAASNAINGAPQLQETLVAKCFANEMVREVCGAGVQLMGGYGYAKASLMERRFRDAWGWGIAGGTIDIQKVNLASELVGRRFNQRS